jgi:hypothetical protein
MLHLQDIVNLERKLRNGYVLTVYVNSSLSNPAEKNAWRTILDKGVADARRHALRKEHGDEQLFDAAVKQLYEALPDTSDVHSGKGWVGFFAPGETLMAQKLSASVPDLVAWDMGAHVSPLFRALKQMTPVILLLADSRAVHVHRYMEGSLEEVEKMEAEMVVGPVYHMGDTPRAGFHAGVRGVTGTDEAERVSRAAATRMYTDAIEHATKLAGDDGWILLGGTSEACSDMNNLLPPRFRERTLTVDSLHMRSRPDELADAARAGASALRGRKAARTVETLAEFAGAGGKGTVGVVPTLSALREHAVQTLYFSKRLMETYPDLAESLVRLALQQSAEIEQLSGSAAEKLDAEFDGIAARLRFVHGSAKAAS